MGEAEIGVYGLGTMGSALALNLAEKGFAVAVANREPEYVPVLLERAGELAERLVPADGLVAFAASMRAPRLILLMIPSGAPVEEMLAALRPHLARGDTVIDAGNSDFHDTRRREAALAREGLHFVGMGVSGGAEGARHGPSMMVGGSAESWARLRPMAEAIAARFDDTPCVAHLGPDGAGHFVKTVHNGIEYADMQMIAEIYGLLRDGGGWEAGRIGALFTEWERGPLASYLVEITARVLAATDPGTGRAMVDLIEDAAGQKGTGRWTVIEALHLGQSASAIEGAVGARSWSAEKDVRVVAADRLAGAAGTFDLPGAKALERALLAGRILSHAQGFAVLQAASVQYGWALDLSRVAEVWRAGCIIRSALLDDISEAFRGDPPQGHLVLAPGIRAVLAGSVGDLRAVVAGAMAAGLPVPALAGALGWYDSLRQARGTANLIQAQRDFFGAHGFARVDGEGVFHGPWTADRG